MNTSDKMRFFIHLHCLMTTLETLAVVVGSRAASHFLLPHSRIGEHKSQKEGSHPHLPAALGASPSPVAGRPGIEELADRLSVALTTTRQEFKWGSPYLILNYSKDKRYQEYVKTAPLLSSNTFCSSFVLSSCLSLNTDSGIPGLWEMQTGILM